jgi:hypothetical protein
MINPLAYSRNSHEEPRKNGLHILFLNYLLTKIALCVYGEYTKRIFFLNFVYIG